MGGEIARRAGTPILVGGHPKSGTSLLLSLLDGHPEVLAFPEETKYFRRLHADPRCLDAEFLLADRNCSRLWRDPGAAAALGRDYSRVDRQRFADELRGLLATTGDRRDVLPALMLAYAAAIGGGPRRYWAEKTPRNELHLDTALRLWPGLRALYVLRDPRDTFASFRAKRRSRGRPIGAAGFARRLRRSLAAWDRFASAHPAAALLLRYEDLVAEPERELRRLCVFLDIAWHPALLEPSYCGASWAGNSMHARSFRAISSASLGGYRSALSEGELRRLEGRLAGSFARFGWPRSAAPGARLAPLAHALDWLTGGPRA